MSTTQETTDLSHRAKAIIKRNATEIFSHPAPPAEFPAREAAWSGQKLTEFEKFSIVYVAGWGGNRTPGLPHKYYSFTEKAYQLARDEVAHTNPITPCGHEAFCNEGNGLYSCPKCESQFPREEMVL